MNGPAWSDVEDPEVVLSVLGLLIRDVFHRYMDHVPVILVACIQGLETSS